MKKVESAEIICVGTEILLGEIVNTNAAFLSRELAAMGICVYHQEVVGDNPNRLADAYKAALERCDLVIMTGGLGPTCDDLTKETVCKVLGKKLILDEASLERIKDYFKTIGKEMTENNVKQALIPEGGSAIFNVCGTAPGIAVEVDGKITMLLPGPPNEVIPMFTYQVVPYLEKYCEECIVSHNLNIIGMGESKVESILKSIMLSSSNPTVAPYAKYGECRVRITARAHSREEAESLCSNMTNIIRATEVGDYIYGTDVNNIEESLIKALIAFNKTVAAAESCTGGLIAKRLTDIPGSSAAFKSGVISYCNEIKHSLLNVSKESIDKYTEVSYVVAMEMARGVRINLGADIGISTTGYAGPGGGTEKDPVGTVYVAISTKDGESFKRLSYSSLRDRVFIREAAATEAMLLALKSLEK